MWLALLPVVAIAQEEGRTLERSEDWGQVVIVTIAGVAAIILVATLGYLYRTRRHLVWDFQQPEEPHGDSHH
jgi:hypothetical protein